jgi:lauroyl/myristoyl acyltransferase
VQWCLENDFALVFANGTWPGQRKRIQRQAKGVSNLREVVRHLKQKGKVIITCDNFNDQVNCPVKFFGNWNNASMFPARLAKLANVPLITAIPIFRNGTINIECGPRFYLNNETSDPTTVTQDMISFLEAAITNAPDIWSPFV